MGKDEKAVRLVDGPLGAIVENVDPAQVAQNIRARVKEGKKIQEFSAKDWMEIFELDEDEIVWDKVFDKLKIVFKDDENASGIASELVVSMKQVRVFYAQLRAGEITEADFFYESEWACLDAIVNILAVYLRLNPIDVKAFGTVITDESFKMAYKSVKDEIRGEWEEMLARHVEQQRAQDEMLDKKYITYIEWLEKDLDTFMELLPRAFSDDPEEALAGSAELAMFMKLPQAEVLSTVEEIDDFFM